MRVVIPQIAWHARDPVLTLDFDPKGKTEEGYYRLASGGADNLLLIWHLKNPDTIKPEIICVSELKRHQKAINVCRFSPCGNYIASGDDDSYVFIWKNEAITEKEETWNVEKILRRHVEDVSDLSWSPDGNFLVSGSVDNSAVLWDVKKGTAIHFWPDREHTGFVQGVAYDPLGEFSATMCIDRNLRFFNNKTGKVMHKTLKYPPAWLGGMEDDDTTKENKPEISEQPESIEQPEIVNVKKVLPDVDQPENIDDKDKPLGEINGMDEEEIKLPLPPKKPVTTLNRLFHDDTLKTFCRRLSCSPRGELLMVPGGLLPPVEKIKEESQSRHSSPVEDEDSKDKIIKRYDPEQNNAVIIFCRNSWTNPCAIIPTGLSYSIAARFSSVYYNREREPYEYDEEFINSNKRAERIVSCIARLRAPKKELPVLLDMPYRLVYAVATNDSILIGDTASIEPLACIKNIHCTRMTDIAWSPDGLVLVASSTDGYCSLLTFEKGELGAEFVATPEEFPTLTPTSFPIAPPEPKPVKKKEVKEKEPKEPKEPKEKKEKKEKVEKEPVTPAEEKETKKKVPLTITKMFKAANESPTTPSLKSPAVSTPVAPLDESPKPESSVPVAGASETTTTPAVSTPKPTFLDAWVKKTPKSSTSEPKPPRRIQLTTLASPSTSSSLVKTPNTAAVISNGGSKVSSSPKATSTKKPRRIPLVTLDDDKPTTQSDTASTCEPAKPVVEPVKCSSENLKASQNQIQKAARRITPILIAATEKKERSPTNSQSNGTDKKKSVHVNGIPNGSAVKSNSQEGNLQSSEASSTSAKPCENPEPMDCAYAEKSAKVNDLEPPVLKCKMVPAHLFLLLLVQSCVIQSAHICVFSVVALRNHRSGYDSLLEALVAKGHNVTFFSTLPLPETGLSNVQHFRPKPVLDYIEKFFKGVSPLEWRSNRKQHVIWDMLPILGIDMCNILLGNEETQKWIKTAQFDLFIVDSLWNECGIGLAHVFRAKHVVSSFHNNLLLWNPDDFGSLWETSWIPDPQYDSTFPISFLQRLRGTLRAIRWNIYRGAFSYYQTRKLFRKHLKIENFPQFSELQQNTSLILVNSHFSEEYAHSIPPMVVPVGGIHIKENSRLNLDKVVKLIKTAHINVKQTSLADQQIN
ncbi:unnamed protein product [Orchesella dallaii]|uniref:CAF1B/HIR1 beta-propeller domain-containing protein n=1 Tax=Orchesella dallaii TaxID=48710 RepID=A0ABP1PW84_9HEXA